MTHVLISFEQVCCCRFEKGKDNTNLVLSVLLWYYNLKLVGLCIQSNATLVYFQSLGSKESLRVVLFIIFGFMTHNLTAYVQSLHSYKPCSQQQAAHFIKTLRNDMLSALHKYRDKVEHSRAFS